MQDFTPCEWNSCSFLMYDQCGGPSCNNRSHIMFILYGCYTLSRGGWSYWLGFLLVNDASKIWQNSWKSMAISSSSANDSCTLFTIDLLCIFSPDKAECDAGYYRFCSPWKKYGPHTSLSTSVVDILLYYVALVNILNSRVPSQPICCARNVNKVCWQQQLVEEPVSPERQSSSVSVMNNASFCNIP